jgi:hypothetical protein
MADRKQPYTYEGKELAIAVAGQENGGFIFRLGAPGCSGTYNRNMPPSQVTAEMTAAAGNYWNNQLEEYCMPQGWKARVK